MINFTYLVVVVVALGFGRFPSFERSSVLKEELNTQYMKKLVDELRMRQSRETFWRILIQSGR